MAADLCAQAVNDLIQGPRAGGVYADEELILLIVHARWTGLDVCQVNAFLLQKERCWHAGVSCLCLYVYAHPRMYFVYRNVKFV